MATHRAAIVLGLLALTLVFAGDRAFALDHIDQTVKVPDLSSHPNPLAGAVAFAAAAPSTAPADAAPLPDVPLPKGFSELGTTPSGRSIFSNFTAIRSVDDLIQHVGDAVANMFDAKPQFGSACVGAKDKNGGIATFSATLKGSPINGIVLFGVDPQGASSATVIYTRPNIPHDEFTALMQTVPAQPKMHTEQMPDGSGSIDIPEGWSCKTKSMTAGAIGVAGPNGQFIIVGARLVMDTPNSFRVQNAKKSHDSAVNLYRLTRGRGVPPEPLESYMKYLYISPCLGPEEAFTKIISKMSEPQHQAGKPWTEIGDITVKQKTAPLLEGDDAEVIGSTTTFHDGKKTSPSMLLMMKVETSKADTTGVWHVRFDQYVAPEATAARDFPLMVQIYDSINIPQAAVKRQLDKDNAAFQSIAAYYRAKNDALLARGRQFQINQKEQFERYEHQQAAQAQARHDACSDMIESSLGVRDVLDTATGQMRQADLYNSTGITDTLNGLANDPHRFVQIPLRYER